jgi:hypothetical protein
VFDFAGFGERDRMARRFERRLARRLALAELERNSLDGFSGRAPA